MTYCTSKEVKQAVSYPLDGAPLQDAVINDFILDAEEEIEDIYKTKFGNIEQYGTADGDFATTTFSDSNKAWDSNVYIGYVAWIYGGTGSGQYREITANDTTKITVSPAFDTTPDATSTYRIVKLGYIDETVDGTGTQEMFVENQPLVNLNVLTIDSVDITTTSVYQYKYSGRLLLNSSAEAGWFASNNPQLINLKYVYGVYPIPRIIKRLCIVLAGIRTLTAQIAGTYDDFTTVTLPGGFSGSKGEPYTNIRESLNKLQGEARGIVYGTQGEGQIGGDFRTGASYRSYTLFA